MEIMNYYRTLTCPKCHTNLGIKLVDIGVRLPYKSSETAECPVCNENIFKHNTRGEDLEAEIISMDNTIEPYKSSYEKATTK